MPPATSSMSKPSSPSSVAIRAWKYTWSSRSPSSSRQVVAVAGLDRLEGLVGLLEQVRRQRPVGLLAVPRAVGAQPVHHRRRGRAAARPGVSTRDVRRCRLPIVTPPAAAALQRRRHDPATSGHVGRELRVLLRLRPTRAPRASPSPGATTPSSIAAEARVDLDVGLASARSSRSRWPSAKASSSVTWSALCPAPRATAGRASTARSIWARANSSTTSSKVLLACSRAATSRAACVLGDRPARARPGSTVDVAPEVDGQLVADEDLEGARPRVACRGAGSVCPATPPSSQSSSANVVDLLVGDRGARRRRRPLRVGCPSTRTPAARRHSDGRARRAASGGPSGHVHVGCSPSSVTRPPAVTTRPPARRAGRPRRRRPRGPRPAAPRRGSADPPTGAVDGRGTRIVRRLSFTTLRG